MLEKDSELTDLKKLVEVGVQFHGHLGPYLVAGIRMGRFALRKLDSPGYKDLNVEVKTGARPPISCLADGIQVATGCTLGKGNIKIVAGDLPSATFRSGNRSLSVAYRPEAEHPIEFSSLEEAANHLLDLPEEDIFRWELR